MGLYLLRKTAWYGLVLAVIAGCGSTKSRLATEQLLMSDAVDHAVGVIDFRSLAGEKVYFDTRYLINVKGIGFVNSEYVISSLRQQMIAADVRLQEKPENASYIVEARVGTLGTDGNEIVYGIPANRGVSEAATMLPNAPALPAIPEISLARKESQFGAVKVAAYAYDAKTGEPVWQSGITRARTTSQDVWLFGAGPFQQGSIHGKTRFAGNDIRLPGRKRDEELAGGPPVPIEQEFHFQGLAKSIAPKPIAQQPTSGQPTPGPSQPAAFIAPENAAPVPATEMPAQQPMYAPPIQDEVRPLPPTNIPSESSTGSNFLIGS
jgi:hypothetical protein